MDRYELEIDYGHCGMTVDADGSWIRYEDHCEAMKRIAGASPEFLSEGWKENMDAIEAKHAVQSASAIQAKPMLGAPDRVYLVVGEFIEDGDDFKNLSGVCWCEDSQFDTDIEYVRADVVRALEAERDALRADAARYRWLRENGRMDYIWNAALHEHEKEGRWNVDAVIDAERGAQS